MKYLYTFKLQVHKLKWLVERQRTRRQLRFLNDEALSDIGITRETAITEGAKPFWR